MTQPKRRTLRPLARRVARTRFGRRVRGWVTPSSQGVRIPFGSIAPPTKGDGRLLTATDSGTTRFIILGEGRSGSSLLRVELNRRWTEIHTEGEVFGLKGRDPSASFEELVDIAFANDAGATIVGFKLFSTHVTEQQLMAMLRLEGMRVIILRRQNALRRYVSEQIARQTGRWSEGRSKVPLESIPIAARSITVDIRHLETHLRISEDRFREFDRLTFRVPKIGVFYEDLVTDLDGELQRLATFLGAGEPSLQTPPILSRQNPESLRNLITNYDEVAKFLRRTGRGELLTIGESETPGSESTPTSRR